METIIDGMTVLFDECDLPIINGHRWKLNRKKYEIQDQAYFQASIKGDTIHLHRVIMGLSRGDKLYVDHIDGNTLDCRRSNLRICTNKQNIQNRKRSKNNTSGYKGVCLDKETGKWHAYITADKKFHSLGCFMTKEEAHAAWVGAAKILHGEFARFE
jgi:hypothetical protein